MTQSITDIKFEHGHDANRLADSVAQLRELCTEQETTINKINLARNDEARAHAETKEALGVKETEIYQRGKTIADQELEINNYANRAVEMKELLAQLQHKYVAKCEELSSHLALSLDAERRHIAYVESMVEYKADAEKKLASLERSVSYMNSLIAENTTLAMAIHNRVIWRKIKIEATERVKRIFARRNQLESV